MIVTVSESGNDSDNVVDAFLEIDTVSESGNDSESGVVID